MKVQSWAVLSLLGAFPSSPASAHETVLIAFESQWEYLNQMDDPAAADADFGTTWQYTGQGFTVAGRTAYDGPEFAGPAQALLSYGSIQFAGTWTGLPYKVTTYFRRKFTLAVPVASVRAAILADDAAILYVDGVEMRRVNMAANAPGTHNSYNGAGGAVGPIANEEIPVTVDLPDLTAGDHIIAVGVYDAGPDSGDLGFDLKLTGGGVPDTDTDGDGQTDAEETFAGTDPSNPGSVLKILTCSRGGTSASLTFSSVIGKTYQVEGSETLSGDWTVLQDDIPSAGATTPVTLSALPRAIRGFVRVRCKR